MIWRSSLAPIHEYADLPFRLLCQRYGADATCVPLVNSTAIARDSAKLSGVDAHPDERNLGLQLVGDEPAALGISARAAVDRFPFLAWLNLNCGCPSERTVESGGGSAMMQRPERIAEAVTLMAKAGLPVSVKLRIKDGLETTAAMCRLIEDAGAEFIIMHGRTPKQGYSGKADWMLIKALKEMLGVPVVGNGDIKNDSEGKRRVEGGYCDGFMIGRAAMPNPLCFSDRMPGSAGERFGLLDEYISLYRQHLGEPDLHATKLKAIHFVSGMPEAAALRNRIARSKDIEGILAIRE